MDAEREMEIYEEECGYICPLAPGQCSEQKCGICKMEEPWFDCDAFKEAYEDNIEEAENRIANEEDAQWLKECEEDSLDDEWDEEEW